MIDSIINRTYLRSMFLLRSLYLLLERWSFRVIKACFSKFSTSSICAFLLLLCLGLFSSGIVLAQDEPGEEEPETPQSHAQSESMKWKGIDLNTVLDPNNPQYDSEYATNGKKIYLFNVGTGRFIIEGGNWGMEGRLFHETFGRPLFLMSNRLIKSGIKENGTKDVFGCNAPKVFHNQSNWANYDQYSFTMMMDADSSKRKGWFFERVSGETGDTYTYYMYEEPKNSTTKYYFGAVYGDWKKDNSNTETDKLVYRDHDRATWTTEANVKNITEKYEVKEEFKTEMIPLNELYQWRLVSEDEFLNMLDNDNIGLNPSVSVQIYDRDFTRNAEQFNVNWITENNSGVNYNVKGRYGFTFGSTGNKYNPQQRQYNNDAWNKPLRLKNIFEMSDQEEPSQAVRFRYGLKNGKYGFLSFEGVGRTYTEVEVPRAGWYLVQCYGFVHSDSGNDAYLFAKVKGSNETSSTGGESKTNLRHISTSTLSNEILTGKNDREKCLEVGKFLTKPKTSESVGETKEDYLTTLWICITEDQFTNENKKIIQIGVGKDEATQVSEGIVNEGKTYYYDTDWVCVDDFRMSYLGLRPAFFYEDEENLNYLDPNSPDYYTDSEVPKAKQYLGASPTGQYGGAICVERSLKTNQWNSFSFPLPLTGEQIRFAFGEDAQLATIHSIGGLSNNPNVIDFETQNLFTTNNVVKPGQFYLLKPTKEPLAGIDPRGKTVTYYELGRKFFSARENETSDYTHFKIPLGTLKHASETIIKDEEPAGIVPAGIAHVNYVQTPDYNSIINSHEYYDGGSHGIYATEGSYVVSYNANKEATTIYHINKNTPLKGFRGWIVLDDPIAPSDVKMSVYDKFDGGHEDTSVESLPMVVTQLSADIEVYDLCGRKVGVLGSNLPKGIYLVNGRKYFVK